MKEITAEFLKEKGFWSNHPERVLAKFHCNQPKESKYEYHITVEQQYKPSTNQLCWNVDCWRSEEGVAISRRSSVHHIVFVEDLQKCIELCNIDLNVE